MNYLRQRAPDPFGRCVTAHASRCFFPPPLRPPLPAVAFQPRRSRRFRLVGPKIAPDRRPRSAVFPLRGRIPRSGIAISGMANRTIRHDGHAASSSRCTDGPGHLTGEHPLVRDLLMGIAWRTRMLATASDPSAMRHHSSYIGADTGLRKIPVASAPQCGRVAQIFAARTGWRNLPARKVACAPLDAASPRPPALAGKMRSPPSPASAQASR